MVQIRHVQSRFPVDEDFIFFTLLLKVIVKAHCNLVPADIMNNLDLHSVP